MGYAPHTGFRAGLCTPFYFFDVKANELTDLRVEPMAFMDTTFTHYHKDTPEQALEKIQQIMRYVSETGGNVIGLWHNSTFTEQGIYKGWRQVFETVAMEAAALAQAHSPVETE
jgi:hypothetical protein